MWGNSFRMSVLWDSLVRLWINSAAGSQSLAPPGTAQCGSNQANLARFGPEPQRQLGQMVSRVMGESRWRKHHRTAETTHQVQVVKSSTPPHTHTHGACVLHNWGRGQFSVYIDKTHMTVAMETHTCAVRKHKLCWTWMNNEKQTHTLHVCGSDVWAELSEGSECLPMDCCCTSHVVQCLSYNVVLQLHFRSCGEKTFVNSYLKFCLCKWTLFLLMGSYVGFPQRTVLLA